MALVVCQPKKKVQPFTGNCAQDHAKLISARAGCTCRHLRPHANASRILPLINHLSRRFCLPSAFFLFSGFFFALMNCQRLVANKYEVAVAVAAVARKLQNYISKLWGMCELWAPAKTLRAVTAVMGHDFERISR